MVDQNKSANLLPREKLMQNGPSSLEQYELLAILLGIGTRKEGVMSIAERIFPAYAPAQVDMNISVRRLAASLSIPISHACKIVALFELHKRLSEKTSDIYIHLASDVYARYKYLGNSTKEYVIGIYLNARNAIIHEEVISVGTVDMSLISTKEVLEPAIIHHAVALIICHNHPSGDPTPSRQDMVSTKNLLNACKLMHTRLYDHIIIGKNKFFSIRERIKLHS